MFLPPFHLTYCLNIYAGETWQETFASIRNNCLEVKQQVSPTQPLALGLRLSAQACQQLVDNRPDLEKFDNWLKKNNFYVFTINIFPYGQFHHKIVKENVYYPDWGDKRRLNYTMQAIDILAYLLPQDITGSLSTVPITYGKTLPSQSITNLSICGEYLKELEKEKGCKIILSLEPEPDCYLETTQETIDFFDEFYQQYSHLKPYIGICFDTCHIALQFEDLCQSLLMLQNAQITVGKVQLSSALSLDSRKKSPANLLPFVEETYLHQTKIKQKDQIYSFADLPEALQTSYQGIWRVHFHLPLYLEKTTLAIETTNQLLIPNFFMLLKKICTQLEIETYTFDVFPECQYSVNESIAKEFTFVKHLAQIL